MSQRAVNTTVTEFVTLEATRCWCGVAFAVERGFLAAKRNRKGNIFCPLGHEGWYGGGEVERLKEELAAKERALQFERQAKENARADAERIARSNVALRGVVKRSKNRATAAMCPVHGCRRHFANLARHMTTKHPDYSKQELG